MTIRRRAAAAALVGLALIAVACGGDDAESGSGATTTTAAGATTTAVGGGSSTTAAATGAAATFSFKPLDTGGPLTKAALDKGDVDIALLFSSDAQIGEKGWVDLTDDKQLQQIENLLPAIRADKATPAVLAALDAISAKLTTAELVAMNKANSVDLREPADIAKEWLEKHAILPYNGAKVDGSLTVGSTNFAEQEIVAELYSQTLASAGASVSKKFQLGAREVVAPALEKGDIDVTPEYVGSYINFLDKAATVPSDPKAAAQALKALLTPKQLTVGAVAAAEDRNTFVVTKATADKYQLKSVSDLAKVKDALTLGGPPECPQRPFCLLGLKDTYGLKFNA